MSAHKFKILNLYKRVLTAHKSLPVDLKHFGDVYVKVEFRQHKNASEKFIPEFIGQWEEYCSNLELDAAKSEQGNKADFGRSVTLDLVENDLTGDQQVQVKLFKIFLKI